MKPDDESAIPTTERILGGFCHDLNGELASAAGFLYLLEGGGAEAGGEGEGARAQLQGALERIETIVVQLRWLARTEDGGPEPISTADLLRSLRALLGRLPRFQTAVVEQIGPGDLPATRVEMHAALRALLTAVDVGTPGGTVPRVAVAVEVLADAIRIGPATAGLHRGREELDLETARAGLSWDGGVDGTPIRLQLPRL